MENNLSLAFHCLKPCSTRFEAEPQTDAQGAFFAPCPTCAQSAKQAAWQRNLMATIGKQTGPVTTQGKANSASNLAGYPTPAQTQVTRFNAVQSGVFAKTATTYPAKPGKYAECKLCEHFDETTPDSSACKPHNACLKKTEIYLLNHIAQETQNPEVLRPLMANFQAGIMSVIQSMLVDVAQNGVVHESPKMWFDKDKSVFIQQDYVDSSGAVKTIIERTANPVLKMLMEFLHKNGMTLSDLALTPKVQEEHSIMGGYTKGDITPEDMAETRKRQLKQLDDFKKLSEAAASNRSQDPTLIEVLEETGGDD